LFVLAFGVYLRLANIHRQDGVHGETSNVLAQGLEKFPNDKNLHLKMALHLAETLEVPSDQMEFHFRSSFGAGDHNFDARFFYAEFLYWSGKIEECKDLFSEIDRTAPDQYRKTAPSSDDALTKVSKRCSFRHSSRRRPVKTLHEAVLHWFARLDVVPLDLAILLPLEDRIRSELSAIVTDHHIWKSPHLSDLIQFPGNPHSGE
jgi:hypothetical protein